MMRQGVLRLAIVLGLAAVWLQAQDPALPQPKPLTVEKLYERIGRCESGQADLKEYQTALVARIRELEAEVAKLKTAQQAPKP